MRSVPADCAQGLRVILGSSALNHTDCASCNAGNHGEQLHPDLFFLFFFYSRSGNDICEGEFKSRVWNHKAALGNKASCFQMPKRKSNTFI